MNRATAIATAEAETRRIAVLLRRTCKRDPVLYTPG
jgi:hypothetical protein